MLLWLFVINLGIVCGAGLYEARIVVPLWASSPPESLRSPDSGRRFWAFVTTVSLTLLTLGNLVAGLATHGPRRGWLFAAVALILIERALTFSLPAQRADARRVGRGLKGADPVNHLAAVISHYLGRRRARACAVDRTDDMFLFLTVTPRLAPLTVPSITGSTKISPTGCVV